MSISIKIYWRMKSGRVRFSSLHGCHSHFNIAIVAVDLFLKVFLAFFEMPYEASAHILDLLLALKAHAVFTANIIGNGIQDALITVISWRNFRICFSSRLKEKRSRVP